MLNSDAAQHFTSHCLQSISDSSTFKFGPLANISEIKQADQQEGLGAFKLGGAPSSSVPIGATSNRTGSSLFAGDGGAPGSHYTQPSPSNEMVSLVSICAFCHVMPACCRCRCTSAAVQCCLSKQSITQIMIRAKPLGQYMASHQFDAKRCSLFLSQGRIWKVQ